ncbi:MAG: tyrosine-type recombinase/integrase, partial [Oscillospiraceae bacterium]
FKTAFGDSFRKLRDYCCFSNRRLCNTLKIKPYERLVYKNFDFHSLRAAHATMLFEQGAQPKDVQHRLGHKNIKVTLDFYAKLTKKMEDKSIDILNEIPIIRSSN